MRRLALASLLLAAACGSPAIVGDASQSAPVGTTLPSASPTPDSDAPGRAVTWSPTEATILNPERGFYRYVDLVHDRDLEFVRGGGDTLVYSYVRLDAYRDTPIDASLWADLQAGLDAARTAAVKVILRFAYNDGPYPDSEPDAPLAVILEHIEQARPLLRANEDVIALVQAGFVGAWGEWHTSTNGLDADPEARRMIVEALLDALPPSRSTQLRYPLHKEAIFGAPLTPALALAGGSATRVGHHNDCFLASDTDLGTYPDDEVEAWLAYLEADSRFVPVGGETCAVFPERSACAHAPLEMERLHWSFVNRDYHPEVVGSWASEGCLDEITRHIGYRFVLLDGELPTVVKPGGSFRARIRLHNEGWAAAFNSRTPVLVLFGPQRYEVALDVDIRHWASGEDATLDVRLRLPAALPPGDYVLALWLPDGTERGRDRVELSIRTANDGTWDAAQGWNVLGSVGVDAAAPGSSDPLATEFRVIP